MSCVHHFDQQIQFARRAEKAMTRESGSRTSISLLERVSRSPADSLAWDEFARQYRHRIYRWSLGWGVQEADADDVAQLVMAKLLKLLCEFEYDRDRSFRGWLKTVARRVWSDIRQRQDKALNADSMMASLEARTDLEARLEAAYDHELLEMAMEQVRCRVEPATWDAFRLTAIEGLPAAEAAKRLVMAVGNVYVAKHRVQKLLQEVVAELEQA
jgi:RNA polymerase sigma factor (sigma-70 family)